MVRNLNGFVASRITRVLCQGEVTPIDSVLTPATAVKNFDLNFWALTA